jgi:cellulose biosynthesis protein BcsQ
MMIIVIGGEKGGTGKTTLATNLAAKRALAGRDVLLIDTDAQDILTDFAHLALSGVTIRDRIAFRKAARDGLCVDELAARDRDKKAVEEVEALYREVFDE